MIHAPTAAPPGYDGLLGFAQQRHVQHFPFRLTLLGVIARLDRAIQYPRRWLLDRPVNPPIKSGEGDDKQE